MVLKLRRQLEYVQIETESSLVFGWQTGLGDLLVDVLAFFQGLLPSDDLSETLDEDVDQLDLGLANAVGVGDVPGATG